MTLWAVLMGIAAPDALENDIKLNTESSQQQSGGLRRNPEMGIRAEPKGELLLFENVSF